MAAYCHLHRNGVYRTRVYIPSDLVSVVGRREIVRSLRTSALSQAVRRHLLLAGFFDQAFNMIRSYLNGALSGDELASKAKALIRDTAPDPRSLDYGYVPLSDAIPLLVPSNHRQANKQRPSASTTTIIDNQEANAPFGLKFADLVKKFLWEHSGSWEKRTVKKHSFQLDIATQFFGPDTPVGKIDRKLVRRYRDTLRKLPRDYSKRFPGEKIEAVAERPETERRHLLKPGAINPYIGSLISIFRWGQKVGHLEDNPAQGLAVPDNERAKDKRHPFEMGQLQSVFHARPYGTETGICSKRSGTCEKDLARYWAPLIALFTGMRRGEIFQLTSNSFKQEGECFYFDIDKAKSEAGIRRVPLHPGLKCIGLQEFISDRPCNRPIFGSATGDAFGKYFTRQLRDLGLGEMKLSFHSFRHTFIDRAREAEIDLDVIKAIVGHAEQGITGTYGNGYSVKRLSHEISKIDFPGLCLDHLVPE